MKKLIINVTLSITTLTFLVGCSAKGPQFTEFEKPKEGKSLVYIYRDGLLMGSGIQPDIHKTDLDTQNDQIVGSIKPSGYIKTELDSDKKIEIWAKTEAKNEVIINTEAQKVYCVKHYITPGFFVGHPQFELQSLDKCEPEIKKTKLSLQEKRETNIEEKEE